MIKLPGHKPPFDFCCGSGALAFDGRGWPWEAPLRWTGLLEPTAMVVVAKTITADPIRGNLRWYCPWRAVRLLPGDGAVNAVGLTNCGVEEWARRHYPMAKKMGYRIAASVKVDTPEEASKLVGWLGYLDLEYVEVNVSCPNTPDPRSTEKTLEILERLGMDFTPLILKLSAAQIDKAFIDAVSPLIFGFHAINTIPWGLLYLQDSPLEKYPHGLQGGVSGRPIHADALGAVANLRSMTDKPIVGGGGIMDVGGVVRFGLAGADAFSLGTVFLRYPWRPKRIIEQYRDMGVRCAID